MKGASSGGVVGSPKMERKTVEKMRRMHMKTLCFKLSSLIPKDHNNKDSKTKEDLLDQATSYIKHMRERIERLKRRKELMAMNKEGANEKETGGFKFPVVEVRRLESSLEVILISGVNNAYMFHEVINVLLEEGVEVMNANFSIANDKILHTIHSQVCSKTNLDVSRISQRLRELIQ